jgi:hypothetical protein
MKFAPSDVLLKYRMHAPSNSAGMFTARSIRCNHILHIYLVSAGISKLMKIRLLS